MPITFIKTPREINLLINFIWFISLLYMTFLSFAIDQNPRKSWHDKPGTAHHVSQWQTTRSNAEWDSVSSLRREEGIRDHQWLREKWDSKKSKCVFLNLWNLSTNFVVRSFFLDVDDCVYRNYDQGWFYKVPDVRRECASLFRQAWRVYGHGSTVGTLLHQFQSQYVFKWSSIRWEEQCGDVQTGAASWLQV